jgi:hypothetical protein
MRRSSLLTVTVLCPHFERPVLASRDTQADRLVDCRAKTECVKHETGEDGVTIAIYPGECPVFRRPT